MALDNGESAGPCPDCGVAEKPRQAGEIRMPGTLHHRDCPQVRLPARTPAEQAEFERELRAIEEAERQGMAEVYGSWIR